MAAITAGGYFSGIPWIRALDALERTDALDARVRSIEDAPGLRPPQVVRYTAHGSVVDIQLETPRWADESPLEWVLRHDASWSAIEQTVQEVPDGEDR